MISFERFHLNEVIGLKAREDMTLAGRLTQRSSSLACGSEILSRATYGRWA